MKLTKLVFVFLVLFVKIEVDNGAGISVKNPYFHYPIGSPFMGILAALAVPLTDARVPGGMFIALNFEASYSLPQNQSEFVWPPIVGATARQLLYNFFEQKLENHGYPGKDCLLRAICEGSEYSTSGTGVLGDIVQIILSPSSSLNTDLSEEYEEAERQAKKKGKCKIYNKKCSFSILDLISRVGKIMPKDLLNMLIKLPSVK